MRTIALLCFLIVPSTVIFAQDFSNGFHLINKDGKSYSIKYIEYALTTRICNVTKPTPKMKNGLAAARIRSNINGFKIVSAKDIGAGKIEITATIEPRAKINCLSTNLISLEVDGSQTLNQISNDTIIIANGKLYSK